MQNCIPCNKITRTLTLHLLISVHIKLLLFCQINSFSTKKLSFNKEQTNKQTKKQTNNQTNKQTNTQYILLIIYKLQVYI